MSSASENQTIGPYRVIGSLGKGGMGEVLLAKDPRLHRKVAIKQIRGGEHPEARQRFQREARLAASLSHASIVSIFDFVEQEDHEYLVMELVDGPSLKVWLEGKVSFEEKLRVAEQIAAGLQYAHRFGVVHRDLKTENVLITPEGQAKIADFGIARRFQAAAELAQDETADANTRDRTELLTREGALIGTYRSMSPEQAQGERADFRSDLFSFGVLLYEMFAGLSPFLADKPLETLFNLISRPHPELDQVAPGLPRPLVRLIDQLLEKDRELRPRSTDEVLQQLRQIRRAVEEADGVTLGEAAPLPEKKKVRVKGLSLGLGSSLIVLVAGLTFSRFWGSPPPLKEIAVLRPIVEGQIPQEDLPATIWFAAQARLADFEGWVLKSTGEVDEALDGMPDQASKTELADALGVDEFLGIVLSCDSTGCGVHLERWQGEKGVENTEDFRLDTEESNLAARSTIVYVDKLFEEPVIKKGRDREASQELFEKMRVVRKEITTGSDLKATLTKLSELRREVPSFVEVAAFEAEVARRLFRSTNEQNYLEQANRVLDEALKAAPADVTLLLAKSWLTISEEQHEAAEKTLAKLDQVAPADSRRLEMRAYLLEIKGETAKALEIRRRALEKRPSLKRRQALALLLTNRANWVEARAELDRVLAKAPHYKQSVLLRAQIELLVGDTERAIPRYKEVLVRFDEPVTRSELATCHLLQGDGENAEMEIKKALALAPENPYFKLVWAEALGLQSRQQEAEEIYREVIQALEAEPPKTRGSYVSLSARAQAHARLGEMEKSVELLSLAMKKAPEGDTQAAVDAALVYTLVKEKVNSLIHIKKVVEYGRGGWLSQPPFEVWRGDPEIGPLLPPPRIKEYQGAAAP